MNTEKRFALVSTVDFVDDRFPSDCVMLFDSEREAIEYAVSLIVRNDDLASLDESENVWRFGEDPPDVFVDAWDLLQHWQQGLDAHEYFHVMAVVDTSR